MFPMAPPPTSATCAVSYRWRSFLLDHLMEFATLLWFLLSDGNLVEEAFLRGFLQLNQIPFEDSPTASASDRARDLFVSQAAAVLAEVRRQEDTDLASTSNLAAALPDIRRLEFLLRMVP